MHKFANNSPEPHRNVNEDATTRFCMTMQGLVVRHIQLWLRREGHLDMRLRHGAVSGRFRVDGPGFGVWGLGFRVDGPGFGV
jgi:hypothetical protein